MDGAELLKFRQSGNQPIVPLHYQFQRSGEVEAQRIACRSPPERLHTIQCFEAIPVISQHGLD